MKPSHITENIGQGTLKMYGQQAAKRFIRNESDDLSTCVVHILKEANASVTNEQISRVCEFSNHAMWRHIFSGTEKTAGIKGGPANPEKVSQEIFQAGDRPSPVHHHTDYSKRPSEIFKTSSARYSKYAAGEQYDMPALDVVKTASTGNPLMDKLAELGVDHSDIQEQFFSEMKHAREHYTALLKTAQHQHVLGASKLVQAALQCRSDGYSFEEMCGVLKQASPSEWARKAALDFIGAGLFQQGMVSRMPTDADFDKVASPALASPQHPLMEAFVHMKTAAENYMAAHTTLSQMQPLWESVHSGMIEKSAGVLDMIGSGVGKVIGGAGRGTGFLAEQAGNLLSKGGNLLGQAATKHPLATAGALGTGYVFGPEVARQAGVVARDAGHQMVDGVTRPISQFGNDVYPQYGTLYHGE